MHVESKRARLRSGNNCVGVTLYIYIYTCVRLCCCLRDPPLLPPYALAERGAGRTVVCVCVRVRKSRKIERQDQGRGGVKREVCMSFITVRVTVGACVCKSLSFRGAKQSHIRRSSTHNRNQEGEVYFPNNVIGTEGARTKQERTATGQN